MHRRTLKPFFMVALLSSLYLSGCNGQQGPPQPTETEVDVITIRPERIMLTSELPGRTAASLVAKISPQVKGLIKKRLFEEGSYVKEGQVLYEIDPAPYQAAYDSAEANLLSAQKMAEQAKAKLAASIAGLKEHEARLKLYKTNLDRYEKLLKTNAASAMQRDQAVSDVAVSEAALLVAQAQIESDRGGVSVAEAAIQQAEAALQTAEIDLGYTMITAPISGRIGRSNVTVGAIVTAYQPIELATIQQLDPIYVDVTQSTVDLKRLERKRDPETGSLKKDGSDKVEIILEDGTKHGSPGELQFRDVTVDPTTGSVILRIVVPNPDDALLPGMFVRAIIDEGVQEKAILIPQQAVFRTPKGEPFVWIVDKEEMPRQRIITTDRAIGNKWLVSSGVSEGDRVIVVGLQKIRPDEKVKAVPAKQ